MFSCVDYPFSRNILYVGFWFLVSVPQVVPKPVSNSRPFKRWGLLPIGGRSIAIKLESGDVWVLASTPLCDETKSKLNQMGPVKYEVHPHYSTYSYPLLLGGC